MTVTRTIIAALAATTLAAPSALARPADMPVGRPQPTVAQDLRSPNARDTATRPANTRAQHLRAGAGSQRPLPSSANSSAQSHVVSAPLAPAGEQDDGVNPATLLLEIVGSVLAVGAIAAIANRRRRTQRPRVTA
jgi:hypothetical protein